MTPLRQATTAITLILAGLLASAGGARAESDNPAALVQRACGSCHLAYLPRFLPAPAWETLMDNLDNHFGENAHLSPQDALVIRRYYTDHAGWGTWSPTEGQPLPRITTQPWWKRAMGGLDFKVPKIKSRANCGACHTHADWYMGVRQ